MKTLDLQASSTPDIDNMINSILQEDLQVDAPAEAKEEEKADKQAVTLWAAGKPDSSFFFCTEEYAKKTIISNPMASIISATSLEDMLLSIDAELGITDHRLTRVTRACGYPILGPQVAKFIEGKLGGLQGFVDKVNAHCSGGSHHWTFDLRIDPSDDAYLNRDISLVEFLGLLEDYGKKIIILRKISPNLVAEISALASGSGPDREFVRDSYMFYFGWHKEMWAKFLTNAALARRRGEAARKENKEQLKFANNNAGLIASRLNVLLEKTLQGMLPDWASPKFFGDLGYYRLLKKLGKFKKLRKSKEYKEVFTSIKLSDLQISLLLKSKVRRINEKRTNRDKILRFVAAEYRRLKK